MLQRLRDELRRVVGSALGPRPAAVALVDFPMHCNVGDLSIWAGELALLGELGVPVAYACDVYGYRRRRIEAALGPDDPILLHGGGNFGDVWPGFQRFRERVIHDFPDRRIIQLPQTIHFASPAAAARTGRVITGHGGVTLLVRDEPSRRTARESLGATATVCPDSAFALRPRAASPAAQPVVWLRRRDHEQAEPPGGRSPVAEPVDWPDHWAFGLLRNAGRIQGRLTGRLPVAGGAVDHGLQDLYATVATRRVALGLRLVARGRVLVTDRLHGHVLACLIGRPSVVVDNTYGKVGAFVELWTQGSPLVRRAATHAEGLALARAAATGEAAAFAWPADPSVRP